MSFIDFCFILALVWLVIFIVLLFVMDGDLSLMFHAKFGKKIRKFGFNSSIFLYLCLVRKFNIFIQQLFSDNLKDEVVWITGASTGIGAACAIQGAKLGAKLVLSARNEKLLKEVKRKCLGKY